MSKPTADWDRIGDRFYRKVQLYTGVFDPDLELENYVIAGAPYSGAVGRHSTCAARMPGCVRELHGVQLETGIDWSAIAMVT